MTRQSPQTGRIPFNVLTFKILTLLYNKQSKTVPATQNMSNKILIKLGRLILFQGNKKSLLAPKPSLTPIPLPKSKNCLKTIWWRSHQSTLICFYSHHKRSRYVKQKKMILKKLIECQNLYWRINKSETSFWPRRSRKSLSKKLRPESITKWNFKNKKTWINSKRRKSFLQRALLSLITKILRGLLVSNRQPGSLKLVSYQRGNLVNKNYPLQRALPGLKRSHLKRSNWKSW